MKPLIFCFLFACFSLAAKAQCPPQGLPVPSSNCIDAPLVCDLNGYCNTLSDISIVQPFPGCPASTMDNPHWFAFTAETAEILLLIAPNNCSPGNNSSIGMQGAIYAGFCNGPLMAVQCTGTLQPFILGASNFSPCETYYLMLDGNAGSVCDYTIEVLSGSTCGSAPGPSYDIFSPSAACPIDSLGSCQKVCANSTVTYEIPGASPSATVVWEVTGAQSFEPNGTQLTVNWGGPGVGEVTALVTSPSDEPFQVFCGETAIGPNYTEGVVKIFGGTPPYAVNVNNNGLQMQPITTSANSVPLFSLSTYGFLSVEVTDAAGNTETCGYIMSSGNGFDECLLWPVPVEINHASSCNACDGSIVLNAFGTAPFSYQWSNGATTQSLSGLCPGIYHVTVSNPGGISGICTQVLDIVIACPSTNICPTPSSLCVSILQEPEAGFTSTPAAAAGGAIEICQGQAVFFENLSQAANTYIWDFGDFNTSTQFEPNHVYNSPGTFTVKLIARNDCYCADTTELTVNVLPASAPPIECEGTVCKGDHTTYTTSAACDTYNWSVSSNATVLDGGGTADNFITVQWLQGGQGEVTLEVDGCNGAECSIPNVSPVAVISDDVEIEGPDKVCDGQIAEYFIPDFHGTDIEWTVQGSGQLLDGQGSNRITVQWDDASPNPQRVIVFYESCFLGCGGTDTLLVYLRPEFYVTGDIEFCPGETGVFYSKNSLTGGNVNANWQVLNAAGTAVWTSSGSPFAPNIPMNFPSGTYTVRAQPTNTSGYCNNRYDILIEVLESPPPVSGISGETMVCPNETYTYQALGATGGEVTWTINNGGIITTEHGQAVNVKWGAANPRTLSVTQTSDDGQFCTSAAVSLTVQQQPVFTIGGVSPVCRESTATYSAPHFENTDYQWAVTPITAGTIVGGQGTEQVEVLWHSAGNWKVEVAACALVVSLDVEVFPLPQPFVPGAEVCTGETITVSATGTFAEYIWINENGNTVSTAANPTLGGGRYRLVVSDANGCEGQTTFEIAKHPKPEFTLSTPIYLGLCPGGPAATIHATTQTGGLTYAWSDGNGPLPGNDPAYTTNQPGVFTVVATDPKGCTATRSIELFDCETIGGICINGLCTAGSCDNPNDPCVDAGNISFGISPTATCNTHNYVNTSFNFVPGSLNWTFGDGFTTTQENPTHTFTKPGFYAVLLEGYVPNLLDPNQACFDGQLQQDTILAVAKFVAGSGCAGEPVEFKDLTEYLPFVTLTNFEWDFGDPASGGMNSSNLQHPSHSFTSPGAYTVTLTVTANDACTTSFSKNVTVHGPPSVDFDPPAQNCANSPLALAANTSADVISVAWNFGDPGSGDANTSGLFSTFHQFVNAGTYPVQVTAKTIYGCQADFTQNIVVAPNTLTGSIAFSQPSPICPGDQIVLTAQPPGLAYLWSNTSTVQSQTVAQTGVFNVTLTDAQGCTFSPPPAVVDVLGQPNAVVEAVEYNEFGQPVAFFENGYTVCDGQDVNLVVQGSLNYNYVWSNGTGGDELNFTAEKNNLLPVGDHDFTVTVTDNTTGCTSSEAFGVTVNPRPEVEIASDPSGFICENTQAELSVVNPESGISYAWNTGELGTSIQLVAGGTYFARAFNQYGCEGRSNEIEIHNAPNVNLIPAGCQTRCKPYELCLPDMPNVTSYQWYLDGVPLPGPNGNLANPVFTESGSYFVEMTDVFGCTSTSGDISLDLYTGYGSLNGGVYFDVNQNGIPDAADTLVSGVNIVLTEGGAALDTVTSTAAGTYHFVDVLAANYTLWLDTLNLPPGWSAIQVSTGLELTGCDDEQVFDWLLFFNCLPSASTVELTACEGGSAMYAGTPVPAGASQDFTLTSAAGCDSTVTVNVLALPLSDTTEVELEACPGTTVDFNGLWLSAGDQINLVVTSVAGCDSALTVTVSELPHTVDFLNVEACENSFYEYQGQQILPGETAVFTQTNQHGCTDSTVVAVAALPVSASNLSLSACGNGSVGYGGVELFPGDVMDFTFQNSAGCDSVVTVTVSASPVDVVALELQVCEGETVEYGGQSLSAGDQINLVFTNQAGCDSTVQVSVSAYEPVSYELSADKICWNASDGKIAVENASGGQPPYLFSLDGQVFQDENNFLNLPGGSYVVFVQDANGCLFERSVEIPVVPPMVVKTTGETLACGDSVLLTPSVVSQLPVAWLWQDGAAADHFIVSTPGVYSFQVSNDCETVERAITVSMDEEAGGPVIYLPSGFSPNFDGINDCFRGYVSPRVDLQHFTLKIFDRWGDMMFETNDPNECWDGHRKGRPMDPAVFVWFIEMRMLNCDGEPVEVFREGGVHLMK